MPDLTPTQRAAIAYATVRSSLGRRAADEGWVSYLWDWVYDRAREPDRAEQAALREAADEFWRDVPTWPFEAARKAAHGRFERLRRAAYERD